MHITTRFEKVTVLLLAVSNLKRAMHISLVALLQLSVGSHRVLLGLAGSEIPPHPPPFIPQ